MPFSYILFREGDGAPAKLSLYANKSCTEQLRKIHGVSVVPPLRRAKTGDIVTVEADVRDRSGRTDSASGSVPLYKIKDGRRYDYTGKDLCNAEMKCETKAKRRATLSICGLAFLDESELDTMQVLGGVTPDGRIYRYQEETNGSHEAAQRVLEAKLASRNPNPIEPEIVASARPASQELPSQAVPRAQIPPREWRGTVEIDWSADKAFPRVLGDIAEVAAHFPKDLVLKRKDDFWHAFSDDVPRIKAVCDTQNFKVIETSAPVQSEKTTAKRGSVSGSGTVAPAVVSGIIERCNAGMAGKYPVRQVTLLLADKTKPTYSCFDKALFEELDKGLGKESALVVKQNGKYFNITGVRKIGSREWLEDGTPVIQRDREPGKTLF